MRALITVALLFASLTLAIPAFAAPESDRDYRETGVSIVQVADAHPYFFRDLDDEPRGMLVDLWNAWSKKTGVPVRFRFVTWKESLSLVLDGSCDIHGGLMTSEERVAQFGFSQPLFSIATSLVVRKDETRSASEVIGDETIGAVTAGLPGKLLKAKYPHVRTREYDLPRQVVEAMANGRVGAVAMDMPTFHFNNILLDTPMEYRSLVTLLEKDIHAGVRKENAALLALVQAGFERISDKERESIQRRWFVVEQADDSSLRLIWVGGGVFLILFALFIAHLVKRHFASASSE